MDKDYKYIGENIRKARQSRNLTIEQLAELCDISESFMGVLERGTSMPSVESLIKIAKVLDVSTDFLTTNSSIELQPSSKKENLMLLLQNSSDDEIDYLIEYMKFYKDKVSFVPHSSDK